MTQLAGRAGTWLASIAIATTIASGSIGTTTPNFIWNPVPGATWYYLWVNDDRSGKIKAWYTDKQAGCESTTSACSIRPSVALSQGACQWWIQTWNERGYGPWSDGMTFTVEGAGPPGQATLISPSGTIGTKMPTFAWHAVPEATWYYLWVSDAGRGRIQAWYTAEQAGCISGAATCSVTPSTVLGAGAFKWWIQTYSERGYGPWSSPLDFTITGD